MNFVMNFMLDSPSTGRANHRDLSREMTALSGQFGRTSCRELPERKRAARMAALTCELHLHASRLAAGFSAVFLSLRYIAKAGYVRAFSCFFSRHFTFILTGHAGLTFC
jgi:hypothetical protein